MPSDAAIATAGRFNAIEAMLLVLFTERVKAEPNPKAAAKHMRAALKQWASAPSPHKEIQAETLANLDSLMDHVDAML